MQKTLKNRLRGLKKLGHFFGPQKAETLFERWKSSRSVAKFRGQNTKYYVIWGHSLKSPYGADQKPPTLGGQEGLSRVPDHNYGRISVNFLSVLKNFFKFFKKLYFFEKKLPIF